VVAIARNGGREPSKRLVVINWNDWSSSIGIAGRHQPVRALETVRSSFFANLLVAERYSEPVQASFNDVNPVPVQQEKEKPINEAPRDYNKNGLTAGVPWGRTCRNDGCGPW